MGNTNAKKNYHTDYQTYSSQYSLSDIIGGSCAGSTRASPTESQTFPRISRRSLSETTLNDRLRSSKTAWPIPRFESMFMPDFPVKQTSWKTEYAFLDVISKGAYGRVYKVQKLDTGEIFALKAISKSKIVAESAVVQAKQEVAIQRMVGHHPFILNSPQRWQGRRTLYIVTDYVNGGELFSLVEEYGCLKEEVVRIYVGEIALAIDFLHNAGIIHRDLKATNVLLDEEGHAVIIDFGLAKWLHHSERTNTFCGTPEYMAPEILKKQYYGHEVDWWSLGVLMCFLLTNRYPDTLPCNPSEDEVDGNVLSFTCPGTLPENAEISTAAKDLLKRLLQPEPRLRLRSLLALQRVAFYMGHDLRSYVLKKESPFRLLGRDNRRDSQSRLHNEFSNFESFVGSTDQLEGR